MTSEVRELRSNDQLAYREFLEKCDDALFTHSWKYQVFIASLIPNTKNQSLVLADETGIRGALPLMIQENLGVKVLNSLPFFGSHGGVIVSTPEDSTSEAQLWREFARLSERPDVFASTIIESPFNSADSAKDWLEFTHVDSRIGQVTEFPSKILEDYSREELLRFFCKGARNSVTRSFRSPLKLQAEDSPRVIYQLYDIHVENMRAIGGTPKPGAFPEAVIESFDYGKDYKLFTAYDNGILVAGLLVFYFKDFVDYFMPATRAEYRVEQPMSGLILLAMEDAITRGAFRRWNWGGTWHSQQGVYDFKRKFGAVDYPYRYLSRLSRDVDWSPQNSKRLSSQYPFFYIAPFPESREHENKR